MNGLCNGVDANIPLEENFDEAFENLVSTHKRNLQNYTELITTIENSPHLKITNPIEGASRKIQNYYLKAQKRSTQAFEQHSSKYNALLAQEPKLQLEIDQIRKNSEKIKEELSECKEEYKCVKEEFKIHKYALNLAEDMYGAKFGMSIDIKIESGNVFVAFVYFSPDKNLPVKFTIDREQNKIIDFDATSILTKDEEREMKIKFKESGNIIALTTALRHKVVKQA